MPDARREAGDPRVLGLRRFGARFMPRATGSGRTEGARHIRSGRLDFELVQSEARSERSQAERQELKPTVIVSVRGISP